MAELTPKQAVFLLLLLSCGLVACLYFDILFRLNDALFYTKGDGLKNYFNFLYHIKWDPQYSTFSGMNYPYGETIFMVDVHPLYANVLKFVSEYIFDINPYAVGILNFTMLASIPVTAIFLYLILERYGVSPLLSILGALAITFLASNALLWRHGHYALSYACFFPIAWYLLLKYQDSRRKVFLSVVILLHTLFWFYIHNYLGLIILGFTTAYHVFNALFKWSIPKGMVQAILIQVILPTLVVYSVIAISDDHPGRISMPFQADHAASFYTIFLTQNTFAKDLYEFLFDLSPMNSQPWSVVGTYIGLATNLVLIAAMVYLLNQLIRRRKVKGSSTNLAFLASSIAVLLFSMGIPFRYDLEFLLPDLLKQFIGLGRFGWPFYFVITVFTLVFVLRFKRGVILFCIASLLQLSEGIYMHYHLNKSISDQANLFQSQANSLENDPRFKEINFDEFQAILPIPFYHKYITPHSFSNSLRSEQQSMALSLKVGLPLMSAVLSRPSVLESKSVMQVFLPRHFEKPVLTDLNEKAILIQYTGEATTELEADLLDRAEEIFVSDTLILMRLNVDSLELSSAKEIEDFLADRDDFIKDTQSNHYYSDTIQMASKSFDDLESDIVYFGDGAMALQKNAFHVVYMSEPGELETGVDYELSFWYYNHIYDQSFNTCWIDVKNSEDSIVYYQYFDPILGNIYDGFWHLNRLDFRLENEGDYVLLCSQGTDLFSDTVYFDELLVRPKGHDVYRPIYADGVMNLVLKNNIPYAPR